MKLHKALCVLLLIAQIAGAQEESVTDEPTALPHDVAAGVDERIDAIEAQKKVSSRLIKHFEGSEGLEARLYGDRIDSLWAAMFNDTVTLARDIAALDKDGFDVDGYSEDLARDLDVFPEQSVDALARLSKDIIYPPGDLAPAELAIQDQLLLRSTQKIDFVYQSLITYSSFVDELGTENKADLSALISMLEESAANRSAFLQLAIERREIIASAAATLPTDTDVAARLAVSDARVQVASEALQNVVGLMNQMDLEASHYSKQVVSTTGELTSDVCRQPGN